MTSLLMVKSDAKQVLGTASVHRQRLVQALLQEDPEEPTILAAKDSLRRVVSNTNYFWQLHQVAFLVLREHLQRFPRATSMLLDDPLLELLKSMIGEVHVRKALQELRVA